MKEDKQQETHTNSQDLLNYSIAINWLKQTFPEERYDFQKAAKALSEEIKRRVTPPEAKEAKKEKEDEVPF